MKKKQKKKIDRIELQIHTLGHVRLLWPVWQYMSYCLGLVMVGENIFEKKVISPNTMVTQYFLYQQSYNEYPDQFTLV